MYFTQRVLKKQKQKMYKKNQRRIVVKSLSHSTKIELEDTSFVCLLSYLANFFSYWLLFSFWNINWQCVFCLIYVALPTRLFWFRGLPNRQRRLCLHPTNDRKSVVCHQSRFIYTVAINASLASMPLSNWVTHPCLSLIILKESFCINIKYNGYWVFIKWIRIIPLGMNMRLNNPRRSMDILTPK